MCSNDNRFSGNVTLVVFPGGHTLIYCGFLIKKEVKNKFLHIP